MRLMLPQKLVRTPGATEEAWGLADSLRYTRWLARHHYENFHVVSFLLPRRLHQDFYNVYAFCRWADDLGDEMGDPALRQTALRHAIPIEPLADLIRAFLQDQTMTRYPTYAQLLDYCVYSANPVGRLVL